MLNTFFNDIYKYYIQLNIKKKISMNEIPYKYKKYIYIIHNNLYKKCLKPQGLYVKNENICNYLLSYYFIPLCSIT
jgi:hypothetical protein